MTSILVLYDKYGEELKTVKEEIDPLYYKMGGPTRWQFFWYRIARFGMKKLAKIRISTPPRPSLGDIESEVTYMQIRERKPKLVVEMACGVGWSSIWILKALKENGSGVCQSYDLIDTAKRNVPEYLRRNWEFKQGFIQDRDDKTKIDYLFVDCDHSGPFAKWYIKTMFPQVEGMVSVHDVFLPGVLPDFGEADVIKEWLTQTGKTHDSASPFFDQDQYSRCVRIRKELGLKNLHPNKYNSMVFFTLP